MRQLGLSSTLWFKNQALPRTQARLASVMWLSTTVRSMSSQTQPQNVQVASWMIFNSPETLAVGSIIELAILKFRAVGGGVCLLGRRPGTAPAKLFVCLAGGRVRPLPSAAPTKLG